MASIVFPVPGGPKNTTFSPDGHEVQGAQVRDDPAAQGPLVVVVAPVFPIGFSSSPEPSTYGDC